MACSIFPGQVFDMKVRACSQLVHRYIEHAASPFPELVDVATFFNMDTALSTVQAIACQNGSVCVEDTPVYSLFGGLNQIRDLN